MIDLIEKRLQSYSPWMLAELENASSEAGVIMLFTDRSEPSIVLTERAAKLSSHAGEVAFPGGKRDLEDFDLKHTALREANEEIGVDPADVKVLGALSQVQSLHGLCVTPYVGVISDDLLLTPNPGEIAAVFKTPVAFLLDKENMKMNEFRLTSGRSRYVPSWHYQGREIWGLTAWVIAECLNLAFDAQIPTRPRPERDR